MDALIAFLKTARLNCTTEKQMQEDVAQALTRGGFEFKREHRLNGRDIIDFLVDDIGIECKIKGQPLAIHRQAERYLQSAELSGIIIVTAKHLGTTGESNGKKIAVVKTGEAWL